MNLWISKNKKLCIFSLVLCLGLTTISKQERNTPGDKNLSSGDSIIRGNMVKINNYENISKHMENKNFSFLEEIVIFQEEEEYPQGICMTDDFVLISSYSGVRGNLGTVKIFDKNTGECLLVLGMDENSHLGGIAFDGKNIWVCNSSNMTIERIPYSFVLQMIQDNKGQLIDVRNLVEGYRVNNIPSTVTYYDDCLWVATHSVWTNATMVRYHYNEVTNQLNSQEAFWVPPKVQGVTFTDHGEVFLSTSYGRTKPSFIKKYKSVYAMTDNVKAFKKEIELPPCSEGIVYEDKKLYILFESAGKKYLEGTDGKGKSIAPIDKILVLEEK